MSSHHIIRDNQEPALLIANTQAVSFEKIQELLEWMPTVVVLSHQVDSVISWGIKVDVVIAPLDELDKWKESLLDQSPIKIITYNPDESPLGTAFYFLSAAKSTAVNCLLSRIEDLSEIEMYGNFDLEAFVDNKLWRYVRKGHYEKWFAAGTILYQYPLTGGLDQFISGRFQVRNEGMMSFKSEKAFWIGEELN